VTDDFMEAYRRPRVVHAGGAGGRTVTTTRRGSFGARSRKRVGLRRPGLQFDTTINAWHTCPNTARINASNPCSEYMFLDNSACNLASLNLRKYLGPMALRNRGFQARDRDHHLGAGDYRGQRAYPTPEIGANSLRFRPLGLGYANLGSLIMSSACPTIRRRTCLVRRSHGLMTGWAYRTARPSHAT